MCLSDQNWCDAKPGMCGDLSFNKCRSPPGFVHSGAGNISLTRTCATVLSHRSRKDAQSPHGTWSSPRSAATIEAYKLRLRLPSPRLRCRHTQIYWPLRITYGLVRVFLKFMVNLLKSGSKKTFIDWMPNGRRVPKFCETDRGGRIRSIRRERIRFCAYVILPKLLGITQSHTICRGGMILASPCRESRCRTRSSR